MRGDYTPGGPACRQEPRRLQRDPGPDPDALLPGAWPEDLRHIARRSRGPVRCLAGNSVVFNVRDPARELLALLDGAAARGH